jgi:aspartate/methionine/tyrosine aminotransferase
MNRIEQTRLSLIKGGKKIINLSSGNANEFGIFFDEKILRDALKNFTKNPAYNPDPKGSITARKAIQKYYSARGLKVNPEQILLTSGTSESYFHIFKMLAKPRERILFPRPGYPLFEEIGRLAETDFAYYNLDENDGWQIDADNLESKIRPDTKAIVLISPSNPTGSVISGKTLGRVIKIAQKHNLPIISDEVFSEFIFEGDYPRIASQSQKINIFTLNGISKTYALPGLKLSWVVVTGPDHLKNVEQLERSADAFLACNQISQAMLPEIINKGSAFIKKFQKHLTTNRNLAIQILGRSSKISFHKPEGGFYLFAKIKGLKITDEDFVIQLLKKTGIFVHPGYYYDYDKGLFILISLLPKPRIFKESLKKILNEINRIA